MGQLATFLRSSTRLTLLLAGAGMIWASVSLEPQHAVAAPNPSAEATAGALLFKQRCASCHAVAGQGGKLGPDLARVLGRKAGSTAYAYSNAMKASQQTWNTATLDAYLAAPTKAVPGTKMVISVSKPEDRKAIIAYLSTLK